VSCAPVSLDQYGRTVATCSVGGADLGEWLVRNGYTLDWPQYSKGKYGGAEREAEHRGRGLWAGSYVERGCTAHVSGWAGSRVAVRMMQTHILEKLRTPER
jgi:endonuclease YncB( thermonuclease family)